MCDAGGQGGSAVAVAYLGDDGSCNMDYGDEDSPVAADFEFYETESEGTVIRKKMSE